MGRIMMMLISCAVLATAGLAQVGDARRGIRDVDFRNFTFSPACVEQGTKITVTNGVYERSSEDDTVYFEVQQVVYGDLTRDGVDEAVVRSICNTGGTGQFSDGTVFTMRGGKPVEIATLGIGDRADGGIHGLRIDDGVLVVERYGQRNSGACCPEYIETERFRYDGKRFAAAGKPARRIYLSVTRQDETGPLRVRFLKGTSSATLSGTTNGGERYVLGVRAEQTLDITFSSKDARASVKIVTPSGTRLMTLRPNENWEGRLPETGDVTIAIESPTGQDSSDAYFDIDLSVH